MTIRKGSPWGEPAPLPEDGVVARSDSELRSIVSEARRAGRPLPPVGLLGGDLCRTLGGSGEAARLRSERATTFPVDVGAVLLDGRLHWFVAHLVGRSRLWGRAVVAMNAQWIGGWNAGPRAHPGDALLDVYEAELPLAERLKVRARIGTGSHLPHPGIRGRRASAVQVELERPLPVALDGDPVGPARSIVLRVEPDALRITI